MVLVLSSKYLRLLKPIQGPSIGRLLFFHISKGLRVNWRIICPTFWRYLAKIGELFGTFLPCEGFESRNLPF